MKVPAIFIYINCHKIKIENDTPVDKNKNPAPPKPTTKQENSNRNLYSELNVLKQALKNKKLKSGIQMLTEMGQKTEKQER